VQTWPEQLHQSIQKQDYLRRIQVN